MVDLADLERGDRTAKGRPFPSFDTSKVTEVASGISGGVRVMKDALGGSGLQEAIGQLTLGNRALQGADRISEQLRAITTPLSQGLSERLSSLTMASKGLRDGIVPKLAALGIDQGLIDRATRGQDFAGYLDRDDFLEPLHRHIEMPPNPIFETNALLEQLSSDFEALKSVSAATADVQEKQATLIAELLKASVEGAAAQEKAAAETLKVAKISMWISLAAVLLTFAGVGAQALLG